MSRSELTRKEFLCSAARSAAGTALAAVSCGTGGRCAQCAEAAAPGGAPCAWPQGITLRPYQLMCLICALGEGVPPPGEALGQFVARARDNPDLPLTLACDAGDVYGYQDTGTGADTGEGRDFNRRRDLEILRRMGWAPGATLPARTALKSLHKQITSTAGICGFGAATADAWRGCPKAGSGHYENGRAKGLASILVPRAAEEMAREKEKSVRALGEAQQVTIRPHILLCAVCQYGGGTRPPFKPDNLPELLDLILHKKPDLPIKMARQADWMMCAPCPSRVPALNACVNVLGSGGLSNEKRDLDMLRILGLQFGSTMTARELFRLIFEKIPSTQPVCKRDNLSPSVWWDGCGESNLKQGNANYERGRRELMEKFAQIAK